ncbi:MAG: phosphotransferase, partial [Oscillospiraceae bacterium]|nr:phosphotransferase [Oscillospiraceae bacterium]
AELDVPASRPVDFGVCDDGKSVYQLLTWIDGEDAAEVLPTLNEAEQYALGIKSGEILRKIHSIPAPVTIEPWATRFQRKIDDWVEKYNSNPAVHSDIGAVIIEYLRKNCRILENREQTFIHGDFNTENIIICNGELGLIDFNSYNSPYGDPWWEFYSIAWTNTEPIHYFRGQINGYFSSNPPEEFFAVLAYYCAYCALTAIADTEELNGQSNGVDVANMILRWYDNFNSVVPSWYLQDWSIENDQT